MASENTSGSSAAQGGRPSWRNRDPKERRPAVYGTMPPAPEGTSINRRTPLCRAIVDRQTLHIHDLLAEVDTEYPDSKAIQEITGTRTSLSTPLLREGVAIGAIHVRRPEVRP